MFTKAPIKRERKKEKKKKQPIIIAASYRVACRANVVKQYNGQMTFVVCLIFLSNI